MANITIRELLEAGVHFGHEARRWNPKMRRYIFEERNGIHIIDLQQTVEQVENAYKFIRETVAGGKSVLFVGTKRQGKEPIREAALRCGMFHVTERWLGGLLTNNRTIRKSIGRLKEIEGIIEDGTIDRLPKKEVSALRREKAKLDFNLTGIKEMKELPGALFIVDTKKEKIAVAEAKRLRIPVVALVDTNSDPEEIDFPIASNDDAIRAITLVADKIAQACSEGARLRPVPEAEEKTAKARKGDEDEVPAAPKRTRARKPKAEKAAGAEEKAVAPEPAAPAGVAEEAAAAPQDASVGEPPAGL